MSTANSTTTAAYTLARTADGYEIHDEHGNYVDGYDRRDWQRAEERLNALNTRAAELAALVPDPATWEAVSAEPTAGADAFETIPTASILDQLTDAVDAARVAAEGDPRWLRAIDRAWDYLLQQDAVSFDRSAHALRVESATEAGTTYVANGACGCRAFAEGAPCWHRAAARLVRRALESPRLVWRFEGTARALGSYLAELRKAVA